MNKALIITVLVSCLGNSIVRAQKAAERVRENITFSDFIQLVSTHNIMYAAEKYYVKIQEASIEASKVFPDPSVSFNWNEDREHGEGVGYGYESVLGTTIDLGGKRAARIDLANSEYDLSKALLADYFRNLRAEATLAYLDALKQEQLFQVSHNSWLTMKRLSEADSIRFSLGSITRIDAVQSKLEAGILQNELIHSKAEWENSLSRVTFYTGISKNDTLFYPVSHLHDTGRLFSLDVLINEALSNRADLLAALQTREVSEKALILARKERRTDLNLSVGISNSYLRNTPSPNAGSISGGIEVPLKFSNIYKGDIKMAAAYRDQSEELYRLAEIQIMKEISEAWNLYYAFCRQVESFENGMLDMASEVLHGKIYSYQRGETSLLEVLNAQRTFNDIQTAYYEAMFSRAAALVNLETAAGIWDIDF